MRRGVSRSAGGANVRRPAGRGRGVGGEEIGGGGKEGGEKGAAA